MHRFVISLLLLCLCGTLWAQHTLWVGYWAGKLAVGDQSLTIAFHIAKDDTGAYHARLDVPQQGVKGMHVSHTQVTGMRILIKMDDLDATFSGRLYDYTDDDPGRPLSIDGFWQQNGHEIRTQLIKGTPPPPPNRPQTPVPPLPYMAIDVEIDGPYNQYTLAGTLTLPQQLPPKASVLLVTGSGPQDRDETLFDHKPFAVIAHHLTSRGYAVLRVDDRGVGASGGTFADASTKEFAEDAHAAIAYMRERAELEESPIGILGHSEGGLIAAMAAQQDTLLDFIIMLAGPGTSGYEVLTDQNHALLRAQGYSRQAADAYRILFLDWVTIAMITSGLQEAVQQGMDTYKMWREEQTPQVLKELGDIADEAQVALSLSRLMEQLKEPWMQNFLHESPLDYLGGGLVCPVLAMFGGNDIQVLAEPNSQAVKDALANGKSLLSKVITLPGHNHLFQQAPAKLGIKYGDVEQTISPKALQTIEKWLDSVTGK